MTKRVKAASRTQASRKNGGNCRLSSPGWNEKTRRTLERLIDRGTNQNLPVVFDFDNTLVAGDLQEATLAVLARLGKLTTARIPSTLSPSFRLPGGKRQTLAGSADITEYYEAFLEATAHGKLDPTPMASGYAWAIEVLEGLRVSDVVDATMDVCRLSRLPSPSYIEVAPGKARFLVPTFYPEMVELVAWLIRQRFDVWIASASNVWGVRCMVQNELNTLLRQHGVRIGIRPDHIIGTSTLMKDRHDHLYKDALLVQNNPLYAALDKKATRAFRLTSRLQFPVPIYSGKVSCIFDAIGRPPHLCVGDSPGDLAMLAYSENRLWLARLEKPDHHLQFTQRIRSNGADGWMLQAISPVAPSGFVPNLDAFRRQHKKAPAEWRAAARQLSALSQRLGSA